MIFDQVYKLDPKSLLKPKKSIVGVNKPMVIFSFDDGYETDYNIARIEMENRNIKGTSFIVPTWVGQTGHMTWNEVKELHNNPNWDIQCHTYTHQYLAEMNETEIRNEMENVNQAFIDNGLPTPQHHAYPFGSTNELVRQIVGEYRLTQRATGLDERHYNDYRTIVASEIKGISVDAMTQERLDLAKRVLLKGMKERKIMYVYCHRIVHEDTGYPYQTLYDNFIEILNYINYLGLETFTVSEFYNKVF